MELLYTPVINVNIKQGGKNTLRDTFSLCDKCEYKASQKEYIKIQIKSIHGYVIHTCDLCEYKAKHKDYL